MIITKTPYRISFFGGGSDYPSWYNKFGGSVLSTTINKFIYISCRELPPFFDHKYRIVQSKIENVKKINEIQHLTVRKLIKYNKIKSGLEKGEYKYSEVLKKIQEKRYKQSLDMWEQIKSKKEK